MGNRYQKVNKPTVAQQAFALRMNYVQAECKSHKQRLDWTGVVVPTPLSDSCTLRIIYQRGFNPKTYVSDPALAVYPGKNLPHVYSKTEQRLCLYYPGGRREWNESMSIATTIVPWASEWLFFYEIWLATGEWLGGGIHLETGKIDPKC